MRYLLTTAPVDPDIVAAATASGVSVVSPRRSLDETEAIVSFADNADYPGLLDAAAIRSYIVEHTAEWEPEL